MGTYPPYGVCYAAEPEHRLAFARPSPATLPSVKVRNTLPDGGSIYQLSSSSKSSISFSEVAMTTHGVKRMSLTRVSIVIASCGRPVELSRWAGHIDRQTHQPHEVVLSVSGDEDIRGLVHHARMSIAYGPRGSCIQRNHGMEILSDDTDVIAFFDDDYVPSKYCIEGIARLFDQHPAVIGATGHLLADGINGPGIPYPEAEAAITVHDANPPPHEIWLRPRHGLYGCNMAFRRSAIASLTFDESLPRYGWQEDVDFARRAMAHGEICGTNAFVGVHQGVKVGRSSGRHLGYSQIANPIYLTRKGTMTVPFAARLMMRNLAANAARSLAPEPWIDRKGRLTGNMIALADVLRFRSHPSRILEI